MRFIAGSGILSTLLLLTFAFPNQAWTAPGDILSTSRTNVNVRATPTTTSEILETINPGETIIEIDIEGDWHRVSLPDRRRQGWIYSPLLDQVFELPEPVAAAENQAVIERAEPSSQRSTTTAFNNNLIGDPARGETVFYKCGSCHTTVADIHAEGPSLVGVFGRSPAGASTYRYSGAMQAFAREGAVWDETTLDRFIQRPAHVVRGTSMPFSGLRSPQDRADVIAFLERISR